MKKNHLVDVTHTTAEEFEDSKVTTLEELMEIPSGALFESLIRSISDPNIGKGRPACFKVRNNGVIVTMLVGIIDVKTIGVPTDEVVH